MSGCAASIRRVASTPDMPGIDRSISTTSGRSAAAISSACVPLAAPPTTVDVVGEVEQPGHAGAQQGVVVDEQHPDRAGPPLAGSPRRYRGRLGRRRSPGRHRGPPDDPRAAGRTVPRPRHHRRHPTGTSTFTVVPAPGAEVTSIRPPTSPARSSRSRRPIRGRSSGAVAARSKPTPSSATLSESRSTPPVSCRRASRSSTALAPGMGDGVAQRLLGDAERELLGRAAEPPCRAVVDHERRLDAARRRRRGEVAERRGQTHPAQVGRMDVDDQRAQRPDAGAHGVRGEVQPPRLVPGAGPLGGHRRPGQRDRGGGEVLDDAVVQVRGDPATLGVRRRERAVQHQLAVAAGPAGLPRQPGGQRELHELQQHQRPDGDRQELQPDRGRRGRPPSSATCRSRRAAPAPTACARAGRPRAACRGRAPACSRPGSGR